MVFTWVCVFTSICFGALEIYATAYPCVIWWYVRRGIVRDWGTCSLYETFLCVVLCISV